jgi:predicted dienelactone hydrolase
VTGIGYRAFATAAPVHALYPTASPPRPRRFGDRGYPLAVADDADVAGDRLPLVVVSHGTGSTPWLVRELAAAIAGAGFVVLLLEHAGNRRGDDALAGTLANLANRPRHFTAAVDAALVDPVVGPHVIPRVAGLGHSLGGYTAVAVAGGKPLALPHEAGSGVAEPVEVVADPRVACVVLLAPALYAFLAADALAAVRVPVLARAGERDELVPPFAVEQILRGLPVDTPLDYAVVPGAGHFAFCTPFPAGLVSPAIPPSLDPPGFDRARYQPALHEQVVAFVRRHLVSTDASR